jgi:hypothetical protein
MTRPIHENEIKNDYILINIQKRHIIGNTGLVCRINYLIIFKAKGLDDFVGNHSDQGFEGNSFCQIEALTRHVPGMSEEIQEKSVSLTGILVRTEHLYYELTTCLEYQSKCPIIYQTKWVCYFY